MIKRDYSHADWDGLRDHLRDDPLEDIFKLGASAAAGEFCQWGQIEIDLYIYIYIYIYIYTYIPYRKYQVRPHSSP